MVTFGQPRVGNIGYANAHDRLVPNSFRIVHRYGPFSFSVPHLFFQFFRFGRPFALLLRKSSQSASVPSPPPPPLLRFPPHFPSVAFHYGITARFITGPKFGTLQMRWIPSGHFLSFAAGTHSEKTIIAGATTAPLCLMPGAPKPKIPKA